MKFGLLIIALLMIAPISVALRRDDNWIPKLWTIVGVACFLSSGVPQLGMAVISWSFYVGHTKGFEITLVDIILAAAYLVLPAGRGRLPFRKSMIFYFVCVAISAFYAQIPMAALFYSWQLMRMFFVFLVVTRACADERVPPAILNGFAIGLLLEAVMAVYQRYGLADLQPDGTFSHQNLLGLVSNLAFMPITAVVLAHRSSWAMTLAPLGGGLIAVLTVSRATLAVAAIGTFLTFVYSVIRGLTRRKVMFAMAVSLAMVALVPLSVSSFQERFSAQLSEDTDRRAMIEAATMIIEDHPLGIGANNFVVVANTGEYYNRAEVFSRQQHVHNLYWLTGAEIGYAGCLALVLVLLQPLVLAFRCSWRFRREKDGDLLAGLGMSLLAVYAHSWFEWVLITDQAQYFLVIVMGLIAGISMKLEARTLDETGSSETRRTRS